MESIQSKALKIIGVKTNEEKNKYKIEPADNLIDQQCMNKMTKILGNQDHYVTKGLKKKELIRTFMFNRFFKIKKIIRVLLFALLLFCNFVY